MERAKILEVIRRTAQANGGIPLGHDRLADAGVPPAAWGRYWARLSTAQREAGVEPNRKNQAVPEEEALSHLVKFIREIGAIPTSRDRVVRHNQDPTFPSERVWKRLGPNSHLLARLARYAETHPGHEDVLGLCNGRQHSEDSDAVAAKIPAVAFGSVYLLKGPANRYKIGRTNAFGRRRRELSIQLPFDTRKVHVIETDDPVGVEAYWHQRFAGKRINSEWFELDAADVASFKRWKRLR